MNFAGPRLVAWEITKRCGMGCVYCRASASAADYPEELSTKKCRKIIDEIASLGPCILIISGGDPLLREDVFEIVSHATSRKLTVVMAVNPDTFNKDNLKKIKDAGVKRISISLDSAEEKIHDSLRGVTGAFSQTIKAMQLAKTEELEFQINTTVTCYNLHQIPKITHLAVKIGAKSFHPFFLVPTGRGEGLKDEKISPLDYERTLTFLANNKEKFPLEIKTTCAPHFYRILHQQEKSGPISDKRLTGCLGGISFAFISNTGKVYPCGYLQVKAGDLKARTFTEIWENSKVFNQLRDRANLRGKCGICRYRRICGGCRARAFTTAGDYLSEEPYCVYQPVRNSSLKIED